jgi:hypothetical protein
MEANLHCDFEQQRERHDKKKATFLFWKKSHERKNTSEPTFDKIRFAQKLYNVHMIFKTGITNSHHSNSIEAALKIST